MLVYRGEKRFLSVELAAVVADGDSFTGSPAVEIVRKRGMAATDMLAGSPAAPAFSGTEVQFWCEVSEAQAIGVYLAIVSVSTTNGETIIERAPIIVQ